MTLAYDHPVCTPCRETTVLAVLHDDPTIWTTRPDFDIARAWDDDLIRRATDLEIPA